MKIGLHANSIDNRGGGQLIFDYAKGIQTILGHEVYIYSSSKFLNETIERCRQRFIVDQYDIRIGTAENNNLIQNKLEYFIDRDKLDFLYFIKAGNIDGILPKNCKTGIHCVFTMAEPHGDVYAGISEYTAKKYNKSLYVPHIVNRRECTEDVRKKLGIPHDALVLGRHGGMEYFNLPFVQQAIRDILKHRQDIWFLFLSTRPFINHERVIFLPWLEAEQDKYNAIHACDGMIHARLDGEMFGIAVGEFSCCNKPVITWSGKTSTGQDYSGYDKAHIDILSKKAIVYNNYQDVLDIFYSLQKVDIQKRSWDVYSKYNEANVIDSFNTVFLK